MKRYEKVASAGLDVHYKFSTVTMREAQGKVAVRERLDHVNRAALRRVLAQWPRNVPFVLEASFGWAWLAEEMQQAGLSVALSNCYKVEQMRKARGLPKTNRKDADLLSLLAFESSDWWRVWMPPPAVRDRREWTRHRSDLVGIGTMTKNRIHAIFHRHGIFHNFSDLFGGKGRRFLGQLCRDGRSGEVSLAAGALAQLRGNVRLLDQVRRQLAELERELRRQLERTPLIQRLKGIPGLGLILANTLAAEIGQIDRFGSARSLRAYSLLAPICQDTGQADPSRSPLGRHLGRRGNRTLKWAFIEAAHAAVRSGGKWRQLFDRYTDGGRRNRNQGYIRVAGELVKIVYVVWRKEVQYTDTPPAPPGRRERAEKFLAIPRSGTGQPSRPMAAVQ